MEVFRHMRDTLSIIIYLIHSLCTSLAETIKNQLFRNLKVPELFEEFQSIALIFQLGILLSTTSVNMNSGQSKTRNKMKKVCYEIIHEPRYEIIYHQNYLKPFENTLTNN